MSLYDEGLCVKLVNNKQLHNSHKDRTHGYTEIAAPDVTSWHYQRPASLD